MRRWKLAKGLATILTLAFLWVILFGSIALAQDRYSILVYRVKYDRTNGFNKIVQYNWEIMNRWLNHLPQRFLLVQKKYRWSEKAETEETLVPKAKPSDDVAVLQPVPPSDLVPQPKVKPQEVKSVRLTAEEKQMIDLINQERTARGLAPLQVDLDLVRTARMKSADMVENSYFGHNSPRYGSPFDLMRREGISFRYAGENLAGAPSVEKAHQALMGSEGHRRNILNPRFTHIGVGIAEGGPYGKMFTQHFVGR
ncbi:CAP domain-containing protein [Calderihabitans maritimus]|uniref:SCP domain-containing protein n=1 Tax=Calderihabitans maritimus TaxID=1246530 RepID=A0A1Z5HQ25_9FIRM|nr:CAP domain-containing protein [Calderihabitans maritimus]GAW91632.1 conserved exported protein of unknown function [Calderihabitans maritimus]